MLTIAQVESETGLSKDVLRVWERRYGFPKPQRTETGERLYDEVQVSRLHAIKRLMNRGFRPGRLLLLPLDELEVLARDSTAGDRQAPPFTGARHPLIDSLAGNDTMSVRHGLSQLLAKQGLRHFAEITMPALNEEVGNGWAEGWLDVYQEHLYTEEITRIVRAAIAGLPMGDKRPRILLTTLVGEEHGLGLLMVEAMLAMEGAQCINLGLQMPLDNLVRAALAHRVDVLALSFSLAFSAKQALPTLHRLRRNLPSEIDLWAGGAMVRKLSPPPPDEVTLTPELADCLSRLDDWRQRHGS